MQLRGSLLVLPASPQLKNHTGVLLQSQPRLPKCPPGPRVHEQPCPRATNPAPLSPAPMGSAPTGEKRSGTGLPFSLPSEPFWLRGNPEMILEGESSLSLGKTQVVARRDNPSPSGRDASPPAGPGMRPWRLWQ